MSYPNTNLQGLIGFAASSKTTGGTGGNVITVNTISELQSALSGNNKTIVVLGTSLSTSTLTKVFFGSNKTLIGSFNGKNLLENIHLRATSTSSNVIFQNLIFKHSENINGNDDIQLYLNYGTKYWIDHCSWLGHNWSANDNSLDKLIYVGDSADYVTISNSYFSNHKYGCIFGHPADDNNIQYNGFPHLTICRNRYENIEVRAPGLMRYGYFHVFNNFINGFQLGFTIAQNANILSENNIFASGSEKGGMLDDKGNGSSFSDYYSTPTLVAKISKAANWTASSNYSYKLLSNASAQDWVIKYSGAQSEQSNFVFP